MCMCLTGLFGFTDKAEALFHIQFIKVSGLEPEDVTVDTEAVCANSLNISTTVNIVKLFKALLTSNYTCHDCPSLALRELNSRGRLKSAVTK